ncbi:uncharacterized protein KD926_010388 [Aspergillus affinis]|uniref:uncharacterized protein n=1 Tax=Aspergillus affinis TaxID=1070780 RepID=UPI0022FDB878|nr:uncharacterized protein KD926_010388 [Aspergillus affinis]KAI9045065.1 hypothetical protein KD926_010388 [Aspergillus affinis]
MEQRNSGSMNASEQSGNTHGGSHDNQNGDPAASLAEGFRYYKDFLEQLLDLVRRNDQADLDRIISMIRSGASNKDILTVLVEVQGEGNLTGQE